LEPSSGTIKAGQEIQVTLICHLVDKLKYEDAIGFAIEHCQSPQVVAVRALGGGCSIVSEPPVGECVDFGVNFSGGLVSRTIKLTNKSSRAQNICFQLDTKPPATLSRKELAKEKEKVSYSFSSTHNTHRNYIHFSFLNHIQK
jgi:hypothetical protein